jgi:hypothetical protein
MKVIHTHTMKGTLLVIIDNKDTYEVSRSHWSSHLQIKGDPDTRTLLPKELAELKKLYWNSDASKY